MLDLDATPAYSTVVSVSTLEHVGLDEDEPDPDKPRRAIERHKAVLVPGGLLWVPVPVGYNAALDELLRDGPHGFTRLTAMRRDPVHNTWRPVCVEQVRDAVYDRLLYTPLGLVVAEYRAPQPPGATRR